MVILETERLLFRQHIMADMDAYCAMEMDPDVRRYVGGRPRTREEAEFRFMPSVSKIVSDRLSMWGTIFKPEEKYIGRYDMKRFLWQKAESIENPFVMLAQEIHQVKYDQVQFCQ